MATKQGDEGRLKMGFLRDMFRDAGRESLLTGSRPVDLGKRCPRFKGYSLKASKGRFHAVQLHESRFYELRCGDRTVWNVTAVYLDSRLRAMVAQGGPEPVTPEAGRIQAILGELGFPPASVAC